jgi:cell division protein FtsI (penicillin-binding protein 3)
MRMRIAILAALLIAGACAVVERAWDLQIRQGPQLREMAQGQHLKGVALSPKRGAIYDRTGAELAVSIDVQSLSADPRQLRELGQSPAKVAAKLAPVLGLPRKVIEERLTSGRSFAWIKRRLSPSETQAVRALALPGLRLNTEARRYYPNRELASHVLGYANIDGTGIEGLELSLDSKLRGTATTLPALRDRRGKVIFAKGAMERAEQGADVTLSLDKTIQHFAERELELAVRSFEAKGGSVVALDPRTGEILAMANYPTFNPNQPASAPPAHRRNRSITDRFEPGSTIKPFTLAGALARNPSLLEQRVDCEQGAMRLTGYTIHDTHAWGELLPAEILAHSSNIGAAKLGLGMGASGLYRTLRDFGFGAPTGVLLPGEVDGVLRDPKTWYELDAATISFGQGLSVTTLQLATSMAALANHGRMQRPSLVKRITTARGDVVATQDSVPGRQVVPAAVADAVAQMLVAVTADAGTGSEAAIPGVSVAGKTGTAQKPDPVHGGYADGQWLSSFVGFAPADAPRLVLAVVIDEPIIAYYGGTVAAPTFRRIMAASLRHLDATPLGAQARHLRPEKQAAIGAGPRDG